MPRPASVLLFAFCSAVLFSFVHCRAENPAPLSAADCRSASLSGLGRAVAPRLAGLGPWEPCDRTSAGRCPGAHLSARSVSSLPNTCSSDDEKSLAALQRLVLDPEGTDEALTKLEAAAHRPPQDAIRWNDLAVAYFLRAERQDRPADLVRAHDAVSKSLALDGSAPEARFNRALIESALLPPYLGAAAWEPVIGSETDAQWATEARSRQAALAARRDETRVRSWEEIKKILLEAADLDDRAAIREHLGNFPAQEGGLAYWLLLGGWAQAQAAGDSATAKARLTSAHRIAEEIVRLTGDRLAMDAVEAVREAVAQGDKALIRNLVTAHSYLQEKNSLGGQVAHLREAQSPLAAWAEIQDIKSSKAKCEASEQQRLAVLARQLKAKEYNVLAAMAFGNLGLCPRREVERLSDYEEAIAAAEKGRDQKSVAVLEVRRSEILLVLGEEESGWTSLAPHLLAIEGLRDLKDRMTLFLTTAKLATALGNTGLALQLLTAAIELGRSHEKPSEVATNLAVAYRARGAALLTLEDEPAAAADLEAAELLSEANENEKALLPMLRVAQAEAAAKASKSQEALALWKTALDQLDAESPAFLRAQIHFGRAELYQELGDSAGFKADLQAGLGLIEEEERHNLEVGPRGLGDAYFDRFAEVAEQYVTLLLDSDHAPDTFLRLERGRAFEPLTRLRDLPLAPAEFRALTAGDSPLDLAALRRHLPTRTALLSYSVLPDRLLVWVVTADGAWPVTLPVGREQIRTWADDVRRALDADEGLSTALEAPYPTLVAAPLAAAGSAPVDRLVLVLDEELHQLPFAALRNPETQRYLIQDRTVSVAPSATLFLYSLLRDAEAPRDPRAHALLVGNPAFDPRSLLARGLRSLGEAAQEVLKIRSFYPTSSVVLGPHATRRRWLAELPSAAVVHYGGHAVANERAPSKSLLLLAPEGETPGEILADELLGDGTLPRTRLVVLAACSTAGGQPIGPLGLAPLVRPFLEAGVPGVVGTLWDVDTFAAQYFSETFHERLSHGLDAATALRETQLAMLDHDNDFLRRPESWAAYALVGFASSPFPSGGGAF